MSKAYNTKAFEQASFYNDNGEPYIAVVPYSESGAAGSSSGSAGGGGFSTYSNASDDFTATANSGAKTITITGLPFTLTAENVANGSVNKIDSSGNVEVIPLSNVTVSSGVITLGDADNFAAGDSVVVTLIGPDKAYDHASDTTQSTVANPPQYHRTDSVHILDEDTQAVANYYYSPEFTGDTFPDGAIQLKASIGSATGVVFRMYMTLNPDAATPTAASAPSADWVDVTSTFWGSSTVTLGASSTAESDIAFLSGHERYVKGIISYDLDNATNEVDIWIIKGY